MAGGAKVQCIPIGHEKWWGRKKEGAAPARTKRLHDCNKTPTSSTSKHWGTVVSVWRCVGGRRGRRRIAADAASFWACVDFPAAAHAPLLLFIPTPMYSQENLQIPSHRHNLTRHRQRGLPELLCICFPHPLAVRERTLQAADVCPLSRPSFYPPVPSSTCDDVKRQGHVHVHAGVALCTAHTQEGGSCSLLPT